MLIRARTAIALLFLIIIASAASLRADESAALGAITAETVQAHIDRLASEDFAGRGAGEEGGKKAGEYLAAQLKSLGVEPAGDDGTYFQNFTSGRKSLRNVIGTIKGTADPEEVVVIGAHYDHLGLGHQMGLMDPLTGRDKIHPGADDNGSGTAGVLTLAKAFAASGEKPRRRVVFIFFDGEELGLLGSHRYVRAPSFPLESTAAMLNMDMVGRAHGKLIVYGTNTGTGFKELVGDAAKPVDLALDLRETMPPNSDHHSFYRRKIPTIALFTGLHRDYHRATDTAEKIDAEGEAKVLRIAWGISSRLARGEERPVFSSAKDGTLESIVEQLQAMLDFGADDLLKPMGGRKAIERQLQRLTERMKNGDTQPEPRASGQRPRLGVQIGERDEGESGVLVDSVVDGSIADKAGVLDGDVILSIGGAETNGFDELRSAIAKASGKVKIVVERDGKRVELEADFGGAKKRWL